MQVSNIVRQCPLITLLFFFACRPDMKVTPNFLLYQVVLPCLLDLFPVLHKPPPAVGSFQKDGENPSDQVMQLILTHMEMEHKIALRRLYARNLPALQERFIYMFTMHRLK